MGNPAALVAPTTRSGVGLPYSQHPVLHPAVTLACVVALVMRSTKTGIHINPVRRPDNSHCEARRLRIATLLGRFMTRSIMSPHIMSIGLRYEVSALHSVLLGVSDPPPLSRRGMPNRIVITLPKANG
jgi:hypothetical protein